MLLLFLISFSGFCLAFYCWLTQVVVICVCVWITPRNVKQKQQKSCALPVKYVGKWIPSPHHMSVDSLIFSALSVTVTMCTGLLLCQQDMHRSFPEPSGKYHVHRVLAILNRMTSGFPAQHSFLGPW